jgi:hypothetical protein
MKTSFKLKALAVAVAALAGTQSAHALTPWINGAPDLVIYTSGGAAQDAALERVITTNLAATGTVHKFQDDANRFTGFYFTGSTAIDGLPGTTAPYNALSGKKIYIAKRSLGAAGYGVVPLLANGAAGLDLDNLNIFKTTAAVLTKWKDIASTSNGLAGTFQVSTDGGVTKGSLTGTNAADYLDPKKSDAGFTGVDAATLLQPGTLNYPQAVIELSTGFATAGWVDTLTPSAIGGGVTVIPTGGLVYGIGVTKDLYQVLQKAQILTGSLSGTYKDSLNANQTTLGRYEEPSLPSLSRNFLAAIFSGSVATWNDVKVVPIYDTTGAFIAPASRVAVSLRTLASTAYSAGPGLAVALPAITPPVDANVGVGVRNPGAAIGAVGYAKLLNYPNVAGSYPPADASFSAAGDPIQQPGGAGDTGKLLADWNGGTATAVDANGVALNTAGHTLWGLALNSADKLNASAVTAAGTNTLAVNDWRYIKIDGAAPTIENVFSGNYPYWAEGEVLASVKGSTQAEALLTSSGNAVNHKAAKNAILSKFAKDLGNDTTVSNTVNTGLTAAWGVTGIFPTTVTDPTAISAIPNGKVSVFEHNQSGNVATPRVGVVPVPRSSTGSPTVILQLK